MRQKQKLQLENQVSSLPQQISLQHTVDIIVCCKPEQIATITKSHPLKDPPTTSRNNARRNPKPKQTILPTATGASCEMLVDSPQVLFLWDTTGDRPGQASSTSKML